MDPKSFSSSLQPQASSLLTPVYDKAMALPEHVRVKLISDSAGYIVANDDGAARGIQA